MLWKSSIPSVPFTSFVVFPFPRERPQGRRLRAEAACPALLGSDAAVLSCFNWWKALEVHLLSCDWITYKFSWANLPVYFWLRGAHCRFLVQRTTMHLCTARARLDGIEIPWWCLELQSLTSAQGQISGEGNGTLLRWSLQTLRSWSQEAF